MPSFDPAVGSNMSARATQVRPQLLALTSLRFFAALIVLATHVRLTEHDSIPQWIGDFLSNGYSSVTFFFILSGFVLTYAHSAAQNNGSQILEFAPFLRARFARVYPAYALSLAMSLPFLVYAVWIGHTISRSFLLKSALLDSILMQAWFPDFATSWNIAAWSLSVEAFLYLSFPVLLRTMIARPSVHWIPFALVFVLAANGLRYWIQSDELSPIPLSLRHDLAAYFPLLFLPHFLLGMAVSRKFILGGGFSPRGSIILFCVSSTSIAILFASKSITPAWIHSDAILAPLFASMILGGAGLKGPVASVLSSPLLVHLGESSYALYILHIPMMVWWQLGERMLGIGPSVAWLSGSLFSLVAISVSSLTFLQFERSMRRWLLG